MIFSLHQEFQVMKKQVPANQVLLFPTLVMQHLAVRKISLNSDWNVVQIQLFKNFFQHSLESALACWNQE